PQAHRRVAFVGDRDGGGRGGPAPGGAVPGRTGGRGAVDRFRAHRGGRDGVSKEKMNDECGMMKKRALGRLMGAISGYAVPKAFPFIIHRSAFIISPTVPPATPSPARR